LAESSLIFAPAFGAKKDIGSFSFVAAGDAALSASRETDAQAFADFAGLFATKYRTNTGLELGIGGGYMQSHDATGLGRDEGGAPTADLDRWERTTAEIILKSRAPNSPIAIELSLRGHDYEYLNNQADTEFMDRLAREASFSLNYSMSDTTAIVAGTKQLSTSYRSPPTASRDFDEHTHWLGLSTSITGAVDLSVKGGRTDRNITDVNGEPDSRGFWDAELDWTPETRTRITLNTSGDNSQSFDLGTAYLKNYRASAAWHNDWLAAGKWSTDLSIASLRTEHIGRATPREDDTLSYSIQFNRKIGANALISANFTRDDRESNVAVNEYQRDTATVTMSTSF
jgi:hypothetical protein